MTSGSLRILVVEDEALILMATVDILRDLGHDALRARNAAAALAFLGGEARVHVVLTDINLPDMDGQKLAVEARRLHPGLPVVFATGYRIQIAKEVAETGPTAILCKPYRTKELVDALRKVLPIPEPGTL